MRRQRQVHPGLVYEEKTLQHPIQNLPQVRAARLLYPRAVSLVCVERLPFKGSLNRCNFRHIVCLLTRTFIRSFFATRSSISSIGASGCLSSSSLIACLCPFFF